MGGWGGGDSKKGKVQGEVKSGQNGSQKCLYCSYINYNTNLIFMTHRQLKNQVVDNTVYKTFITVQAYNYPITIHSYHFSLFLIVIHFSTFILLPRIISLYFYSCLLSTLYNTGSQLESSRATMNIFFLSFSVQCLKQLIQLMTSMVISPGVESGVFKQGKHVQRCT